MTPRTILLVGSSGGLGIEIAKYFAAAGHKLALHYNVNKPAIGKLKNIMHFQADITNESSVTHLVASVSKEIGTVDVVVNCAGISRSEISWKADLQNWEKTMAVNLTGPMLVSKHVLPGMRKRKFGRIIFMSSVVAQTGFAGTTAYAASKAGLFGLTHSMSKELAGNGITVNAIALGYFSAGMIRDVPDDLKEQLIGQIPVGRLGKPAELAALISYLISEESAYMTGQTLNLNGGLHV